MMQLSVFNSDDVEICTVKYFISKILKSNYNKEYLLHLFILLLDELHR